MHLRSKRADPIYAPALLFFLLFFLLCDTEAQVSLKTPNVTVLSLNESISTAYPGWPSVRLAPSFRDKFTYLQVNPSQIEVLENGKFQQIDVLADSNMPMSICILMDTSGSMYDHWHPMLKSVQAFIDRLNAQTEIAVLTFDRQVEVEQQFTRDHSLIMRGLQAVEPYGPSALFDAVLIASTKAIRRGSNELKAIVIFSDGSDNNSKLSLDSLIKYLRYGDVSTISAVVLESHDQDDGVFGKHNIKTIANVTGGFVASAKEADSVNAGIKVAEDLESRRLLMYRSFNAQPDGKFRRVEIKTKPTSDKSEMKLTSRQGFYAPAK